MVSVILLNDSLKLLNGKFQRGQLLRLKLHSILSIAMKSYHDPALSFKECEPSFLQGVLLHETPTLWYGGVILQYIIIITVLGVIGLFCYPLINHT